jgi:hypothetical protein
MIKIHSCSFVFATGHGVPHILVGIRPCLLNSLEMSRGVTKEAAPVAVARLFVRRFRQYLILDSMMRLEKGKIPTPPVTVA